VRYELNIYIPVLLRSDSALEGLKDLHTTIVVSQRLSKNVPIATKNCWGARFLYSPCRVKESGLLMNFKVNFFCYLRYRSWCIPLLYPANSAITTHGRTGRDHSRAETRNGICWSAEGSPRSNVTEGTGL
jgi:hypothetical protein